MTSIRVEVLGSLRLLVDGEPVDVPGPKRRAVLALLAFAEGRTVTLDRLVDVLWPGEAPGAARQAVHTHVSRLRVHLAGAAPSLRTRHEGYCLDVGAAGLDLRQARALLAQARPLVEVDPDRAYALLREAWDLWRGPVLPDLAHLVPLAAGIEQCERLRHEVSDSLVTAATAAGRANEVADLATTVVSEDPLREPAVLQLMRILAATGRAHEALQVARDYRHRLGEETGLDPSRALGVLEREIAGGDAGPAPALATPTGPTTRLVGRTEEVADLHRLLAAERLVTVVGTGGVGKTRVAMEVVQHGREVALVQLAPVADGAAVPHALAAGLHLDVVRGDVLAACAAVLGDRPALLVVDNCEHLLEATRRMVSVLLSACPGLSVLATSREPLGLPAECIWRLGPLRVPATTVDDLPRVPAVRLFLDRARRVRPDLARPTPEQLQDVAYIVRRLEGVPLAIELATGRLSSFSTADLRQRLDRSLDLLGGARSGTDPRHRTLRATIQWSYDLLDPEEQWMFRHLAVFVDGTSLGDVERLASAWGLERDPGSVLARLVDASILEAGFEDGTRYRMLETVRAFGLDRLAAAGEREEADARLLGWAVDLAVGISASITTDAEPEADATLRREQGNLRAGWSLARRAESLDAAAAIVVGLFDAVAYRDLVELRDWARDLADDPRLAGHPCAAAVLGTAAEATYHAGDYERAEELARTGLALAAEGRDERGGTWRCLLTLAVAELARGAYDDVVEHALSVVELAGETREAWGLAALATAFSGNLDRARTLNAEQQAAAVSPSMRAWSEYVSGEIESLAGRGDAAQEHYRRAIGLARTSGATFLVGVATVGLLTVRAESGRVAEALTGYREVIDHFAGTGNWTHLWVTLRNLAALLEQRGEGSTATTIRTAAARAPDAPVDGTTTGDRAKSGVPTGPVPDRVTVLEAARAAIERTLEEHRRSGTAG